MMNYDKPDDVNPADARSLQPVDDKLVDDKPADDKPDDGKPADDKPADAKLDDGEPANDKPADDTPSFIMQKTARSLRPAFGGRNLFR